MRNTPSFVVIAALLGNQARATMLSALMSGEARTASELADEANITKQTASSHLSKLVEARLLRVQSQGRHRYFQLAEPDVAQLLENIMGVAHRSRTALTLPGPRDPALRKARRCYDHLAGELAVEAYDSFVDRGFLRLSRQADTKDTLSMASHGLVFFDKLGIDFDGISASRRPVCRPCLDWSVRRYHLAGGLGKALLELCCKLGWVRFMKGSRIVRFQRDGEKRFRKILLL